jgi:hypothetical protein
VELNHPQQTYKALYATVTLLALILVRLAGIEPTLRTWKVPVLTDDTTTALLVRESGIGPEPRTWQVHMLPFTPLSLILVDRLGFGPRLEVCKTSVLPLSLPAHWCFRPNLHRDSKAENLCSLLLDYGSIGALVGSCIPTRGAKTHAPYC